jgi:hypothetical protein
MASSYWQYASDYGFFRITPCEGGDGVRLSYKTEVDLGYFYQPQMAVDDLVGGHVQIKIPGALLAQIPRDVADWEFVRGEGA